MSSDDDDGNGKPAAGVRARALGTTPRKRPDDGQPPQTARPEKQGQLLVLSVSEDEACRRATRAVPWRHAPRARDRVHEHSDDDDDDDKQESVGTGAQRGNGRTQRARVQAVTPVSSCRTYMRACAISGRKVSG